MRRALILAGGGIRVAWQAGAVQALDEAGLHFDHGDGTSGGIFNLGMLLSGIQPAALSDRWRSLNVRKFVSLMPAREYLRLPTSWRAFGSASGVSDYVLPHLGIDIDKIRSTTAMSGTFNVADFDAKTCVAIPHSDIDSPRLVAGVSLPIFLPAVSSGGRTWTDAVWIKDANLLEAVRRGCTELWLLWCIGNTTYWGNGPLEQYVHMIELSANSALFGELEQIADINDRRQRGEAVFGTTDPVTMHVVKPEFPLPLDPDFLAGRITAETLIAMGYRDAWRYLRAHSPDGVALDATATRMTAAPLGARISLRVRGSVSAGTADGPAKPVVVSFVVEATDLRQFVGSSTPTASVVGGVSHPSWGYRPFVAATLTASRAEGGSLRFLMSGTLLIDGEEHVVEVAWTLRRGRGRWREAARMSLTVRPAREGPRNGSQEGRVNWIDAIRAVFAFEPSGAHDLRDRLRAARLMVSLLR